MPRISDERMRSLLSNLAGEIDGRPVAPERAVARARKRLARNVVAGMLVLATFAYGSIALASRILERREDPVVPAPDSITTGLWLMDADGSDPVQITDGADDDEPAWSPDGRKIAFTRRVGDNDEIFVVDADGSDPERLTRTDESETHPAWTADGRRVAFVRGEPDRPVIYSVAPDGSGERRIVDGRAPSFSFGGKWLTYECPSVGDGALCQTDPAGQTAPVRVDTGGRPAAAPVWVNDSSIVFTDTSPLGGLIAKNYQTQQLEPMPAPGQAGNGAGPGPFESVVFTYDGDVYTAPAGGPKIDRLTFDPTVHDSNPAWNPTAKRIVMRRVVEPATAVYIADADGSNVRRLSSGRRVDGGAVMSPDGSTIAFASSRDGYAAIYLMDADGSSERRITHETAGMVRPLWSPDGKLLYVARMHPMNPRERGIAVIAAAGGVATEILEPRPDLSVPSLSLDGTRLTYAYGSRDDHRPLLVAAADAAGQRPVTQGWIDWPVWGPGNRVAYLDGPSTQKRIAVIDANGANKRVLTSVGPSAQGLWWGTGREILFTYNFDIHAVDPETGRTRVVLALPGNQYNPSWTPDGRILFNGDVS